MASNRIKGLTVEIGGDATGLSDALKDVDSSIAKTQSSLKDVNKLLKFDPSNTTLLAQKQEYLATQIANTKERLNTLKTAAQQANQALANGDISQEQYNALQREIVNTESVLKNLEKQANATGEEEDELGKSAKESGEKAKEGSEGFTVFKATLANLASSAITACASALKELATSLASVVKSSVESYAEYEQLAGGVNTLFGANCDSVEEYAESVGKSVSEVQDEYNKLDSAQNKVLSNANAAYLSAGMSANDYLDTVTSFSSSLISSLEGDTTKAAEKANQAVIDMSDNANKMGTDITDIQNAYQGFAKQNYTINLMSVA